MRRTLFTALIGSTALVTASFAQTNQGQQAQQAQQQAATQTGAQAQRNVTASNLRNQQLYTQNGGQFGRTANVVRDNNNRLFIVVLVPDGRQVLLPSERLAYENNRYVVRGNESELRGLTEYRQNTGYTPVEDNRQVGLAGTQGQQQAQQGERGQQTAQTQQDGSRIVIRQQTPEIQLERAAPQVSVRQPQPNVTVRQPTPEILVRQPAPTVSVDIPQPEIIVRMPRPDVNVSMAQPQVEVRQPQPRVQVTQPQQQPQVQVEQSQPQVNIQQAEAQPQVNIQREGQPQVRYERMGEPRVTVNRPQGQPNIRFEQLDQQGQQRGQQAGQQQRGQQQSWQQRNAPQQTAAIADEEEMTRTDQERRAYQQRFGGESGTAATGAQAGPPREITAEALQDMEVYNSRGEKLGDVERVIFNRDNNKHYVVIAHGGFLGIGEDEVAFPLERFAMRGDDRLIMSGVTEQDIEAMDNWRNQVSNAETVQDDAGVKIPRTQ